MTLRRTTTTRRAQAAVALTAGLILSAAGCGGGDDGKGDEKPSSSSTTSDSGSGSEKPQSPSPSSAKPLAEVKSGDVTVSVLSATRDQGGYVTVSGQVTNNGSKFWIAADWRGEERELSKNGASLAGASLVDQAGKKKYLVLRDTEGRCLCTKFEGGGVATSQSASWYAQFPAPPEGTTEVTFQVGAMPPAPIEISEGE
ncbi:hypothetical protein GTW43_19410 [Streptomyces sp. SID5785]|uniref:hypothetical protein n=1 Tax=Streptomyces sp. SID5785 TaxID=2690309 RepID=UPI001361B290|nr:hypothetical protein [Streptomyces sp. SID5785]MZD07238.1 hypothetical protein [Streptomyces sp. SID5785]